ncbi:hypothetical protein NP493_806g01000 [Ridgeia piscesae]|uniref:Uncharacterized protein n=1 Tax=Ridgeia piscesae TaxID=27915 RepID=A0AAD9NL81_RIDPI|nr:hypothetical protein NP493_806g01000 [Ridgeia piscesae]
MVSSSRPALLALSLIVVFFDIGAALDGHPFENVPWSECDAPCGGGNRSRYIKNPDRGQQIECNMQSCDEGD